MENNFILKVKNLFHFFIEENKKRFEVLKNISFEVKRGEFMAIVGPSGSGKSTLLRIIAGLLSPSHGSLEHNLKKIAMVFQNFAIFPWLSVYKNIEFGLKMQNIPKKQRDLIVKEKIKEVGLEGFEEKYPKELSGGMRQRVGIARALAVNPDLLLMDEPFSSLDVFTAEVLRKDILDIWLKYKMTIIMVTHSVEEAVEMADRILVVSKQPATIKSIIDVNLARPRDKRSYKFYKIVDNIISEIYETKLK